MTTIVLHVEKCSLQSFILCCQYWFSFSGAPVYGSLQIPILFFSLILNSSFLKDKKMRRYVYLSNFIQ